MMIRKGSVFFFSSVMGGVAGWAGLAAFAELHLSLDNGGGSSSQLINTDQLGSKWLQVSQGEKHSDVDQMWEPEGRHVASGCVGHPRMTIR